ncbi:MAG TPA: 4Fe-4S ferredoxin [Clostridiales bacterium]|nr:4Fe-4S ferredoxin [Clostridiales bacterium]
MEAYRLSRTLATTAQACSGCRLCQLLCALDHFGENNVKKAALGIRGLFPSPGRYEVRVCVQCGTCAEVCPVEAISRRNGAWVLDRELCTGCGACIAACPGGVMFTHPGTPEPIKCDACGECVPYCPRNVLRIAEEVQE